MSASESYDGTVSLSRKLTDDETHELRITLLPFFTTDTGVGVDDITDYLDYTFTMVSNSKDVTYIVKELDGLCSPEVSMRVGRELASFINKLKEADGSISGSRNENGDSGVDEEGNRVSALKKAEDKGNALTMSGALGASREGGRNKKEKIEKGKTEHTEDKDHKRGKRGDRNRSDRRDGDDRDGRGNRSVHSAAFDRLARGGDRKDDRGRDDGLDRRRDERGGRGRGRGRGRGDRDDGFDRRRDDRGGRGGRGHGGRGPRDMGGRGGREGGRDMGRFGRGGRGDRISGNRRSRDDMEDEPDFYPADDRGGRGRGRGSGRGGRDVPKRPRYDEGFDDGYAYDGYGYGGDYYDDGYGYQSYPPVRGGRGGRGRGRGRGPGRGGRFFEEVGGSSHQGGFGGGSERMEDGVDGAGVEDSTDHPSPMVQASYGGRGGFGLRGRGFVRGGRGRGRGRGGRAHVVNMIQSKTWVRKRVDATEGENGNEGESAYASAGDDAGES